MISIICKHFKQPVFLSSFPWKKYLKFKVTIAQKSKLEVGKNSAAVAVILVSTIDNIFYKALHFVTSKLMITELSYVWFVYFKSESVSAIIKFLSYLKWFW